MALALSPGDTHARFIDWVEEQGIEVNGVAPAKFIGRGMGIVAARDIKKGERLVRVPTSALLTINSRVVKDHAFPKNLTVHGKLATCIALTINQKNGPYRVWEDVWPTRQEFQNIMPLNWTTKVQKLLPAVAKDLLRAQVKKLDNDFQAIHSLYPSISKSLFTYTWLIVNTRCFYWDYPGLPENRLPRKRNSLSSDDCYALIPFMDYFNHTDTGCETAKSTKGYEVTADRDYTAGEEVYVHYGSHTNDFLLVEYGFILSANNFDSLSLDHLIIPLISQPSEEALQNDGFYGNYTLLRNAEGSLEVCRRTQAVLRLLHLPARRYAAFVGGDEGEIDQGIVNSHLKKLLENYSRDVIAIEEEVEGLVAGDIRAEKPTSTLKRRRTSSIEISNIDVTAEQKDILLRRWKQVRDIVNEFLKDLEKKDKDILV